jgi:hypothetical protein
MYNLSKSECQSTESRLAGLESHFKALDNIEEQLAFISLERQDILARRISRGALEYEKQLQSRADLKVLNAGRLANFTDFDYRFWHRRRFQGWYRDRLEIIAAKLVWKRQDESPGFFAKLQLNGFDWKTHAAVVASVRRPWAESHLRCGIWTKGSGKKRNSGRCKQYDLCALCNFIDFIRLLRVAFGPASGAYHKGRTWFVIHCSVREKQENSHAVGRVANEEDWEITNRDGFYSGLYDPCPVPLRADRDHEDKEGIQTCRIVFLAVQTALAALYKRDLFDGFRQKLEIALRFNPICGLPHGHAVANGLEDNPQFIADELYQEMQMVLTRYQSEMSVQLYPSVRVFSLTSPDDLLECVKYLEKTIPLGLLAKGALDYSDDDQPKVCQSKKTLDQIENDLINLHEQLGHLSGTFLVSDHKSHCIQRRRSLGNMRFGTGFVGFEPQWHKETRLNEAEEQAQRRKKKKKVQDMAIEQVKAILTHHADQPVGKTKMKADTSSQLSNAPKSATPEKPMKPIPVNLSDLTLDETLQCRASIDPATVEEYAIRMDEGDIFPAPVAFSDGSTLLVADGFHRVLAARKSGMACLLIDVRKGNRMDALRHAITSNTAHGLPRSNADKRRSVEVALKEFADLSDRAIADMCRVSQPLVGTVRRELKTIITSSRLGKDGKRRKLPKRTTDTEGPDNDLQKESTTFFYGEAWGRIEDFLFREVEKWPTQLRRELAGQLSKFGDRNCW